MASPIDDPFGLSSGPISRPRQCREVDQGSRRFNEALHRIASGKYDIGGVCHELSQITGLTVFAIRKRIGKIEHEPEPLPSGVGLTSDDMKYFGKIYKNHKDPACREWFQSISGDRRRHPDREDMRVKRERITTEDGTHMASIAIDLKSE